MSLNRKEIQPFALDFPCYLLLAGGDVDLGVEEQTLCGAHIVTKDIKGSQSCEQTSSNVM